jgi:hypothetical protein
VVSANSVLTRSIPEYSVVFGMPASVIRHYDPQSRAWRMGHATATRSGDRDAIAALHSPEAAGEPADMARGQSGSCR